MSVKLGQKKRRSRTMMTPVRKHKSQKLTHKEHNPWLQPGDIGWEGYQERDQIKVVRGTVAARDKRKQLLDERKAAKVLAKELRREQLDAAKLERDPEKVAKKLNRRRKERAVQLPVVRPRKTPAELEKIDAMIAVAREEKARVRLLPRKFVEKVTKPVKLVKYTAKQTPSETPTLVTKRVKGKQKKANIRKRRSKKAHANK